MASGCLGLISFPREPGRLSRERIEALYPRLIDGLRSHPGIGFMLVRSESHGAVAVGAEGIHYLDEERVEGRDPLAPFGPNAAAKVRLSLSNTGVGSSAFTIPSPSESRSLLATRPMLKV